jgi:thiol-disulfide isomerase/thioredoxin
VKKVRLFFSVFAGLVVLTSSSLYCQSGKVPPFQMMQSGGKVFRAQDLPMGKPIVIIYFSPDCEECLALTSELIKREEEFKKASVAMVTYLPVEYVTRFVEKYKLNYNPNIYVGTEGSTLFLKGYYNIEKFPFMALYTKNGDLVKTYYSEHSLDDIAARLLTL